MNNYKKISILFFIFVSYLLSLNSAYAENINLSQIQDNTLGKFIAYFQEEQNEKLSLQQAIKRFEQKDVLQGTSNSVSLGLGVAPVWIKFSIENNTQIDDIYRLAIETPWLDYIDAWIINNGNIIERITGGDGYPFDERPMQYRVYAFERAFEHGLTDVYLRIETKGPMALPIRLSTKEKAIKRDIFNAYEFGAIYGIMGALALYNLVVFLIIRRREYGLYSLYLIGFIINHLSYTGQLHTLITADFGPYFQDWSDTFLMITYSVFGLHFARYLLKTKSYAPKLDKIVIAITTVIPIGIILGFIFDSLLLSLTLAFILNSSFATLFIIMGYVALKAKIPSARLFLTCSVTAALCIAVSTLAVAGIVPYNDFTFKAIEVGMAFEAILLAVILAKQFRMAQQDKLLAEKYARTDVLTGLNNRRGFQEISDKIWQHIVRNKRDMSVILLDIDHFKLINDNCGHSYGDKVLVEIARCIIGASRKGDLSARWGGEEFILFLPETPLNEATKHAEVIRQKIEALDIPFNDTKINVTSSFGVIGTNNGLFQGIEISKLHLEALFNLADKALYKAKEMGRNKVESIN